MLVPSINMFTRMFTRMFSRGSISCHSSVEPVPGGGPTIGHLTCTGSGSECRDVQNVDCIWCAVRQRNMPLMTVQSQNIVSHYNGNIFLLQYHWNATPFFFVLVGNLLATPLEFGTVFRNTTWASLGQEGFSLATTGAQTHWPPKI